MTGEPTLRYGDREKDGWVIYLQQQLDFHLPAAGVAMDGIFGDITLSHVRQFQYQNGLMHDGVVGDQTWAALTSGAPQAPGTDGQAAHTHVDDRAHVVWTEHNAHPDGSYSDSEDSVWWFANNVGNTWVPDKQYLANLTVTTPGGQQHVEYILLQSMQYGESAGPGTLMSVTFDSARASVGTGTHTYVVELPDEVGGGKREGEFTIP